MLLPPSSFTLALIHLMAFMHVHHRIRLRRKPVANSDEQDWLYTAKYGPDHIFPVTVIYKILFVTDIPLFFMAIDFSKWGVII
jgi:hypothetical protein